MNDALTPEQMLRVAVAGILDGVDQHVLAALMGVNQGRINETLTAIRWTLDNHRLVYKLARRDIAKKKTRKDNKAKDAPDVTLPGDGILAGFQSDEVH